MWLLLLAVTAPVRLQPWFLASCAKALASLPVVLERRKQERKAARLSDKAVFSLFDQLRNDPAVFPYDRYQQLIDRGLAS